MGCFLFCGFSIFFDFYFLTFFIFLFFYYFLVFVLLVLDWSYYSFNFLLIFSCIFFFFDYNDVIKMKSPKKNMEGLTYSNVKYSIKIVVCQFITDIPYKQPAKKQALQVFIAIHIQKAGCLYGI